MDHVDDSHRIGHSTYSVIRRARQDICQICQGELGLQGGSFIVEHLPNLQLELLSHHGSEHYCTLSLVRVYGISMVDEFEAHEESVTVIPTVIVPPIVHKNNAPSTGTMAAEKVVPAEQVHGTSLELQ